MLINIMILIMSYIFIVNIFEIQMSILFSKNPYVLDLDRWSIVSFG